MTRASADCTSMASERFRLKSMGDPSAKPSVTYQPSKKEPGSMELVLGRWMEVKER